MVGTGCHDNEYVITCVGVYLHIHRCTIPDLQKAQAMFMFMVARDTGQHVVLCECTFSLHKSIPKIINYAQPNTVQQLQHAHYQVIYQSNLKNVHMT